jgi:hypothetical protein
VTRARELRFVVVVDDYDVATHLFCDVFDLKVLMDLEGQGGRGVILEVPAATLEIVDADPSAWSTCSKRADRSTNACGSRCGSTTCTKPQRR